MVSGHNDENNEQTAAAEYKKNLATAQNTLKRITAHLFGGV